MADIESVEVIVQQLVVRLAKEYYGKEQLASFRRRVLECLLFSTLSCTMCVSAQIYT